MLWHYTTGEKARAIVASGEIRPTEVRIDPNERPAVWFSKDTLWENTASKSLMGGGRPRRATLEEMHEWGDGVYRFGVSEESAPLGWKAFVAASGIKDATARSLIKAGKAVGASHFDWRCSFAPVPRSAWLAVERMDFPSRHWRTLTADAVDAFGSAVAA